MDEDRELRALLSASAVFATLDEVDRTRLAGALRRETALPGHVLLRQGEASAALFVVARGRLDVRLRRDDGSEAVIDTVGRGDVVGELQVIVGNVSRAPFTITRGMRFAQLVIARFEHAKVEIVAELSETQRSAGGFGHTGH